MVYVAYRFVPYSWPNQKSTSFRDHDGGERVYGCVSYRLTRVSPEWYFFGDLELGTKSISISLYRMSAIKLKELKHQLNTCYKKGLFRLLYRHGEHQSYMWRKKMIAWACVLVIASWTRLLSRISILFLVLMIYLTIFRVHQRSQRLTWSRATLSLEFMISISRRLLSRFTTSIMSLWTCSLDWLTP